MWYVIQTDTGQEEELLLFMNTILERTLYKESFIIKAEWMKRLGGKWQIQVRPLFPGYVFVDTWEPEKLFLKLKGIPKLSKLLGAGVSDFVPLENDEECILRFLTEKNEHIIRLTVVSVTEAGYIDRMDGVLEKMRKNLLRVNFHKRYALVRLTILGKERTVMLGIRLERDACAETENGCFDLRKYRELKESVLMR